MASNPDVHILLTRPADQSAAYQAELEARFACRIHVTLAPLLKITALPAPISLSGITALLFTSVNGVKAFGKLSNQRDIPCYCVGDKTAEAAQYIGLMAVSAAGSTQDLVALILQKSATTSTRFLHLHGAYVTGNLAKTLTQSGLNARSQIIYDQTVIPLSKAANALLSDHHPVLIPLFSTRTAGAFSDQIKYLSTNNLTTICISSKVARALNVEKFRAIRIAKTKTAEAITREIATFLR